MTSLVNYRRRQAGKIAIAGYAWYKFGHAVKDGSLIGATSWGLAAIDASIAVVFSEPVAWVVGALILRAAQPFIWIGTSLVMALNTYPLIGLFILLMPVFILTGQRAKARRGLVEPIGASTFEAERVPTTERMQVPAAINPLTGSRVF
jgi:hypothetical protein